MEFEMFLLFSALHIAAGICAAGAVILAYKLYSETDKGWYWLSLFLSALFMALPQLILFLVPRMRGYEFLGPIGEMLSIIGTLLFALSCYGIYKTMKEIRKRVE